jgi:hypothetical protein
MRVCFRPFMTTTSKNDDILINKKQIVGALRSLIRSPSHLTLLDTACLRAKDMIGER